MWNDNLLCAMHHFFIFYFFYLFIFKHLYWSIIASQWCVSFCFITKWISYTYTHVPISPPSRISLPPTLPIPPPKAVTKHRMHHWFQALYASYLNAIREYYNNTNYTIREPPLLLSEFTNEKTQRSNIYWLLAPNLSFYIQKCRGKWKQ